MAGFLPLLDLTYLLSTWRGQPVARVRKVFGHEDSTEMRGSNPVLVYEKRVKYAPRTPGATTSHSERHRWPASRACEPPAPVAIIPAVCIARPYRCRSSSKIRSFISC